MCTCERSELARRTPIPLLGAASTEPIGLRYLAMRSHERPMSGAIKNLTAADKPNAVKTQTIGAGYPRTLLDFAVSLGADRSSLLTRSGLDEASLADQDNHVPLARYVSLLEAAA